MRELALRGVRGAGVVALIDAYVVLPTEHWYLTASGYVVGNVSSPTGRRSVYLHRVVAETPEGFDTDHIDGNKLDNRRANLRIATRSQNNANGGRHRHSQQPHKGIRRHGAGWQARLRLAGRELTLGTFSTPEEASAAYDAAARRHFGSFAKPNGSNP